MWTWLETAWSSEVGKSHADEEGNVYFGKYPALQFVVFNAYIDARVKAFHFHREESLLVTISTEGYVTVWDVEFLVDKVGELEGFDLDLINKVQHVYDFQIEARLICMDSRVDTKKKGKEDEEVVVSIAQGGKKQAKSYVDSILSKEKEAKRPAMRLGARFDKIRPMSQLRKMNALSKLMKLKHDKMKLLESSASGPVEDRE